MAETRGQGIAGKKLQFVGFELGREKFAVDILCVKEIIRMTEITRVPRAPEFVEGIINLRGEVIPVIDLRKRLEIGSREFDAFTRMIIVEIDDMSVGFIVDVVSKVISVGEEDIEPPPEMVTGIDADYIKGVARISDSTSGNSDEEIDRNNDNRSIEDSNRLLMLLDLQMILSKAEQSAIQQKVS